VRPPAECDNPQTGGARAAGAEKDRVVELGPVEGPPSLRADARRNREQIIEAARALFAQVGPDVPMDEIARVAGVGIGTLYRRFPDRDELIKAVSLDNVTRLAEISRRAEASDPDPATALITILSSALESRLGTTIASLAPRVLQAMRDSAAITEQRAEVMAVASRLLRRAQEAGSIRPDIAVGDLMIAVVTVSRLIPTRPDDELGERTFRRLFSLLLDGLRVVPGTPLPGPPVTDADIEALRRTGGLGK
jgi:AcrR family transcriptional regulator